MEKLQITFLGTGNAIPTKQRNHSAILVSFRDENILVDCGEGVQRQFRSTETSPTKITKLFLTHWHGDHVLGIPGLFQTLAMSEYQKVLKIYGPQKTGYFIESLQDIFKDFKINTEIKEVSNETLGFKDWEVQSKPMEHGIPTNAYSIIIKDRVHLDKKKLKKYKLPNSPILKELAAGKDIVFNGKKIKARDVCFMEKGKKVTIILDTGMNPGAIELAKDSDILICESTYSKKEAEQAREHKHLTAVDAATIAKKAKVKQLILTHVSQRYEHNLKILEKEARKIFKNTKIAKDFDNIEI